MRKILLAFLAVILLSGCATLKQRQARLSEKYNIFYCGECEIYFAEKKLYKPYPGMYSACCLCGESAFIRKEWPQDAHITILDENLIKLDRSQAEDKVKDLPYVWE